MGFFDSFNKKKGASLSDNLSNIQNQAMNLPPPPLPDKTLPKEMKEQKDSGLLPLPPPPVFEKASSGASLPNQPKTQSMPQGLPKKIESKESSSILPPVNVPVLQKEAFKLAGPIENEKPAFEQKSKEISKAIPEVLPLMPSISIKQRKKKKEDVILFNDDLRKFEEIEVYEKQIPFFSEKEIQTVETDFDELPALDLPETEELETLKNFRYSELKKPLFIRTDYYTQVLSTIDAIKSYVGESAEVIYSLENLKKNAEIEHKNYKSTLEDMQRKLIYIDKVLFERGG
jgi:hypothetical protein